MKKSIYTILTLVSPVIAMFIMSDNNFAYTMIWLINPNATSESLASMGFKAASIWQLGLFVVLIISAFIGFTRSEKTKITHSVEWISLILSAMAVGYYVTDIDVLWTFFHKHAFIGKALVLIAISGTMALVTRIKPWDKYAKQENVEG